jgi:hypothetical protein
MSKAERRAEAEPMFSKRWAGRNKEDKDHAV